MTKESPITIHRAIVHNLDKKVGEKRASLRLRSAVLPASEALSGLVSAVHEAYEGRAGKSYGAFQADATVYPAQTFIDQGSGSSDDVFVESTKSLMTLLSNQAKKESFATGGHVLMVDVSHHSKHWFLVTLLTDVAGAAIDASLNVVETTHLDLSTMRFAGRVNLTDWKAGTERYISFLRGKKAEVSAYFEEFLGCSTVLKPLVETQHLVKVIKQFAIDQGLEEIAREKFLRDTDDFARNCAKMGISLDLESLANRVWPTDPVVLQHVFAQSDPPIADGFLPDTRALKGLLKFTAKAQNWKLEFDRDAIVNHTITFNRQAGTLTINQLPENIRAQLEAEFVDELGTE